MGLMVLTTVLKTSVLLAIAWICSVMLARASASVRHLVWIAALAAAILLPAASLIAPPWAVPVTAGVSAAHPAVQPAVTRLPVPATAPATAPQPPAGDWTPVWSLLWAAGFAAVIGRFLIGRSRVRHLLRAGTPAREAGDAMRPLAQSLGIGRPVRVLENAAAPMPLTWGVLRPVILLPAGASGWPDVRLRTVLLHELIHIRRLDLLTQMLARFACALYWFNPLVWVAERELRKERERSCDDAVLHLGIAAPDYAHQLVELARHMQARRHTISCAPAMAEAADLKGRVQALLDRRRNRRPVTRKAIVLAALAVVAVMLPLAALRAQAQTAKGALAGVVADPSGGVIPRCAVAARNRDGANQEVGKTNEAGEFAFAAIPTGRYTLEFRAAGFKMTTKDVLVEPGKAARADAVLEIGGVSETVVVTGKGPAAVPIARAAAPRRIRVGGNVQATKLVTMTRPSYPPELQQLGIEGAVLLRAVISVEGSLLNVEVANTDVNAGLAKAALDAVKQWRYQPTLLNGQPVEVVTTITVDFRLER